MSDSFEFFFDYVSPTAYLAHPLALQVEARTGARLVFRPMFLGGVMQATGNRPPGTVMAKAKYMSRDLQRCAVHIGIPFHHNPAFPMNTLGLLRATIGLESDPPVMRRFIERVFHACWGIKQPMDPGDPAQVDAFLTAEGFDLGLIDQLTKAPENKDRLRSNTDEAVRRGAFGAPSFFIGDELYFGHDRLDYLERDLARSRQA